MRKPLLEQDQDIDKPQEKECIDKNKHPRLDEKGKKEEQQELFQCTCGKSYKHFQSLLTHQKKCSLVFENNGKSNQVRRATRSRIIFVATAIEPFDTHWPIARMDA